MSFWDNLWLLIWAFLFVCYLIVLFQVVVDIFRDSKMSGLAKAIWLIVLFIFPMLGALVYVIARGRGMNERQAAAANQSQAATEQYIRSVAGATDPAAQISNAKSLLDAGAITPAEFEQLKAKVLAAK
ncbi:SHOCT domain-containing protein [Propionicicella superfundia]|uniref:SHOCT domain-containing protein n=1 Tax=Propionicicella superfundia TaxID=348582 RepID=UPI000491FF96|nr:SHOCT domain-containing protein [Propionicicella superfundia]